MLSLNGRVPLTALAQDKALETSFLSVRLPGRQLSCLLAVLDRAMSEPRL